jgi:hypothetical protein
MIMKNLINLIITCVTLSLFACANNTSTIGNGKIDPVELATINLAVGVAFSTNPQAIVPAYGVSTALLAVMNSNAAAVSVEVIEATIKKEVQQLKLDPLTQQSFNDFVVLVKAEIATIIKKENIQGSAERLVVIKDVIQIINKSAEARLQLNIKKS